MQLTSLMRPAYVCSACLLLTAILGNVAHATDLTATYKLAQQYDSAIKAAEYDYESAIQRLPLARSLFNRENGAIVDQARLGVKQAEAQLLAQQQNLILRTANTYFDVLRTQVEVEFSGSELEAIARQKEQAERRFDVGLVPVTDVRTAQAQYDLAVAAQIAARNRLQNAVGAMEVLTGESPKTIAPLASDLPLVAPDPANADAWVNLAVQQNLDLVAARLAAETAAAGVSAIRGSRYPTLDFVGLAQAVEDARIRGNRNGDSKSGLIGFEVRMPLYTGGRIKAQVHQAKADSNSANC